MGGQELPQTTSLRLMLQRQRVANVQDKAQATALLQGSWGSSPLKWRPCMSPLRPWIDTSMKDMLIAIANEPLCHGEAVGDNQPLP